MPQCTLIARFRSSDTGDPLPAGNASMRLVRILQSEDLVAIHAIQYVPVVSDAEGDCELPVPQKATMVIEATWPGIEDHPRRIVVTVAEQSEMELDALLQP